LFWCVLDRSRKFCWWSKCLDWFWMIRRTLQCPQLHHYWSLNQYYHAASVMTLGLLVSCNMMHKGR
jgi:hypothetical protein